MADSTTSSAATPPPRRAWIHGDILYADPYGTAHVVAVDALLAIVPAELLADELLRQRRRGNRPRRVETH